jgi:uncharacterized protein (TIGR03083 family)
VLTEPGRVETAHLIPALKHELLTLLRQLGPEDWEKPTLAGRWRVRDVAVHLLDGELRRLSLARDRHRMAVGPLTGYRDVVALINGLNASGVSWGERLSPTLIVDLLAVTGEWLARHLASLDPDGPAHFPVAWAGESASLNWMDVAREYSEHWHHQMQIRVAVGAPPVLIGDPWIGPLLDVSARALPVSFEDRAAPDGSAIVLSVETNPVREWTLLRDGGRWVLKQGAASQPAASVRLDADTAWRLLYNALTLEEAKARVRTSGDAALVEPLLRTRSVMV